MNPNELTFEQQMEKTEQESLIAKQQAATIAIEIADQALKLVGERAKEIEQDLLSNKAVSMVYKKQMLLEEVVKRLEEFI